MGETAESTGTVKGGTGGAGDRNGMKIRVERTETRCKAELRTLQGGTADCRKGVEVGALNGKGWDESVGLPGFRLVELDDGVPVHGGLTNGGHLVRCWLFRLSVSITAIATYLSTLSCHFVEGAPLVSQERAQPQTVCLLLSKQCVFYILLTCSCFCFACAAVCCSCSQSRPSEWFSYPKSRRSGPPHLPLPHWPHPNARPCHDRRNRPDLRTCQH